jgi:hypothetical protein
MQARFGEFADEWRATYPAMITSWETAWGEFVPFLEFPVELRKIVYTTQRDREPQREVPTSGPTWRALPERASRAQGALPRRDATAPES